MKIIVQKYGGTSVATALSREMVYRKILKAKKNGYSIIVIISAMGRRGEPYATDTLLDLIRVDFPSANKRELDLIFTCGEIISGTLITANIQQKGHDAIYLTGQQAGIVTSEEFGDARIVNVNTERIKKLLNDGNIVVVAGGQGATTDGFVTTLGRGGSDTTACALGVAMDAEEIQIYTDVDGILTTDPRIVQEARLIPEISYSDCCQMAYLGAKVIHPRAVEIASQKPGIKLYVRSAFNDLAGTLITNDLQKTNRPVGVALVENQSIFKGNELKVGQKEHLLEALKDINKDIYALHPEPDSTILVMEDKDADEVKKILKSMNISGELLTGLSKISIISENSVTPEDIAEFISEIGSAGIPTIETTNYNNVISAWISEMKVVAVKAVHKMI